MNLVTNDYQLSNVTKINVVLGKNGSGKSTLLKALETQLQGAELGSKKYVTPERGGVLTYEGSVEQNITTTPTYMADSRRVNQFNQFRQQKRCAVSTAGDRSLS